MRARIRTRTALAREAAAVPGGSAAPIAAEESGRFDDALHPCTVQGGSDQAGEGQVGLRTDWHSAPVTEHMYVVSDGREVG